jgi:MYXO-CTERM domain-containing protein
MTSTVRAIPKVVLLIALAAVARPVSATITYTSCSSGCGSTAGTYAIWQTASGSAGLAFSMSPVTFAAGNLMSGVYTDPTGTVLTGYNGAPANLILNGTALVQSVGGGGSGIEIVLPANTYAVAFDLTSAPGSSFTYLGAELGDHNVSATNYNIILPSGGGSVQFFGIISSVPLTEIFVGPASGGSAFQINDFELGESSPTPEASSAALIGGGLVLLGALRRRIHKPRGAVA